ncbi:hypothetical protein I4F81_006929 [Pyropia yezoensis]|uniref:Uncharacterized protein n=1 Tax=Pyropia yezoensis TaxID=2788 RepID=A0ACC3C3U7_PYRYE|nr:hypothetical protein I4F81_006929 [Neopyropia yezoensis]
MGREGAQDLDAGASPGGGKGGRDAASEGLRAVVLTDLPAALPVLAANVNAAATASAAAGVTLVPTARDVLVLLAWERRLGAAPFEAAFFAAAAAAGLVAEALTRERLRPDAAYNWVDVVRLHWGELPPGAVPHRLSLDAEGEGRAGEGEASRSFTTG